jgi:hypothetical protein
MAKLIRLISLFVFNLFLAIVGTAIIKSGFTSYATLSDPANVLRREYILSAIAAFGLGWSMHRISQQSESKWVWIAGLFWFGQRTVFLWLDQRAMLFGAPHNTLAVMLGLNCRLNDVQSCADAIGYAIPCVRTIAYSAGAFCGSRFWPKVPRGSPGKRGTE